jgi:hypothetical protein
MLPLALLFALPVVAGGAVHILAIRADVLPWLARVPLDGGRTCRGRRVLGDNKTLRGVVVMVVATALASRACARLVGGEALAAHGLDYQARHPVLWGALLAAGYLVGELPNSFIKRQLEVAPGDAARGRLAPLFWLFDQCDSLVGALLASSLVWRPPLSVVAWLLLVTLLVHPLAALAMVGLGLKRRVG